jgi:hypothetical protein
MRNNMNDYNVNDCGRYGKAMECSVTGKDKAKSANKVDWYHLRKRYEVKTGAGELGNVGGRLVKGAQKVLYIPVVVLDEKGNVIPRNQEGFILTRENFLQALEVAGALRTKVSTAGVEKVTIQTFWNRKKDAPHGRLYFKILDAMYEYCEETLEDMLDREGA